MSFSLVLKLVRDEADHTLLGREFHRVLEAIIRMPDGWMDSTGWNGTDG